LTSCIFRIIVLSIMLTPDSEGKTREEVVSPLIVRPMSGDLVEDLVHRTENADNITQKPLMYISFDRMVGKPVGIRGLVLNDSSDLPTRAASEIKEYFLPVWPASDVDADIIGLEVDITKNEQQQNAYVFQGADTVEEAKVLEPFLRAFAEARGLDTRTQVGMLIIPGWSPEITAEQARPRYISLDTLRG